MPPMPGRGSIPLDLVSEALDQVLPLTRPFGTNRLQDTLVPPRPLLGLIRGPVLMNDLTIHLRTYQYFHSIRKLDPVQCRAQLRMDRSDYQNQCNNKPDRYEHAAP